LEFGRKKAGEDDSDGYMMQSGVGGSWLRPGGVMTPVIKLNELYDLSIPGKYTVQVLHGGYDLHGGHDDKTEVKSNTIALTVGALDSVMATKQMRSLLSLCRSF
jgi:hypothetical protein